MQWQSTGIVVGIKGYGNTRMVLSLFSRDKGLQRGLARTNRKRNIQVGDMVSVTWRARLENNLGFFCTCEVITSYFCIYFQDNLRLLCLSSIASVINKSLPENDAHPILYDYLINFIESSKGDLCWQVQYLKLEMEVLSQLGFALDLSRCAVSNSTDNLLFISPKTGKAISEEVGAEYKHRLFPLPKILYNLSCRVNIDSCSMEEFSISVRILGHFLYRYLLMSDSHFREYRKLLAKMSLNTALQDDI